MNLAFLFNLCNAGGNNPPVHFDDADPAAALSGQALVMAQSRYIDIVAPGYINDQFAGLTGAAFTVYTDKHDSSLLLVYTA
jgi:hypothetical protein